MGGKILDWYLKVNIGGFSLYAKNAYDYMSWQNEGNY